MRVSLRPVTLVVPLLLSCLGTVASAGPVYESDPRFHEVAALEAKALGKLIERATESGFHLQAWWLARRILEVVPDHAEAHAVVDGLSPERIAASKPPDKKFSSARESALEELGTAWFRFGEQLEASGMAPEEYYPIFIRAHTYHEQHSTLRAALESTGATWRGTFLDVLKDDIEEHLGAHDERVTWPPPWEEELLRVAARWPGARAADVGDIRLLTDLPTNEALELLGAVAETDIMLERWGARRPKAGATGTPRHELLVFRTAPSYESIAPELVDAGERDALLQSSAYTTSDGARTLVSHVPRDLAALPGRAHVAGVIGQVLVRRRFGGGRDLPRGPGSWLLAGIGGAFEGLAPVGPGTKPSIDLRASLHLAAAGSLRRADRWIPWERFATLDAAAVRDVPREAVTVDYRGRSQALKDVDVVRAQATAIALALIRTDGEKGAKRFAKVLTALFENGSLPDLDAAMGWKAGRCVDEATKLATR